MAFPSILGVSRQLVSQDSNARNRLGAQLLAVNSAVSVIVQLAAIAVVILASRVLPELLGDQGRFLATALLWTYLLIYFGWVVVAAEVSTICVLVLVLSVIGIGYVALHVQSSVELGEWTRNPRRLAATFSMAATLFVIATGAIAFSVSNRFGKSNPSRFLLSWLVLLTGPGWPGSILVIHRILGRSRPSSLISATRRDA